MNVWTNGQLCSPWGGDLWGAFRFLPSPSRKPALRVWGWSSCSAVTQPPSLPGLCHPSWRLFTGTPSTEDGLHHEYSPLLFTCRIPSLITLHEKTFGSAENNTSIIIMLYISDSVFDIQTKQRKT